METKATHMKTYADECLERANCAVDGPWINDMGNGQVETKKDRILICERIGNSERLKDIKYMIGDDFYNEANYPEVAKQLAKDNNNDMEFIANARTDVPELARRLKCACEFLRAHAVWLDLPTMNEMAQRLESRLDEL